MYKTHTHFKIVRNSMQTFEILLAISNLLKVKSPSKKRIVENDILNTGLIKFTCHFPEISEVI